MNSSIKRHFKDIELRLIKSRVVIRYEYIRREVSPVDGKIRIKVHLIDGGMIELFEWIEHGNRMREMQEKNLPPVIHRLRKIAADRQKRNCV